MVTQNMLRTNKRKMVFLRKKSTEILSLLTQYFYVSILIKDRAKVLPDPFRDCRKKTVFFSGPATKALPPPHKKIPEFKYEKNSKNFFQSFKKRFFFFVAKPLLPLPLLVSGPLKKILFCGFTKHVIV